MQECNTLQSRRLKSLIIPNKTVLYVSLQVKLHIKLKQHLLSKSESNNKYPLDHKCMNIGLVVVVIVSNMDDPLAWPYELTVLYKP